MAKKFMYVCLGILALVVAFHLGAQYGSASVVDRSQTGIIACHREGTGVAVITDNGQTYSLDSIFGWSDGFGLPVPASEVKFYDRISVVTYSNDVWVYDSSHYEEPWQNFGPPPGYTATQPTTWSEIKAEFGE